MFLKQFKEVHRISGCKEKIVESFMLMANNTDLDVKDDGVYNRSGIGHDGSETVHIPSHRKRIETIEMTTISNTNESLTLPTSTTISSSSLLAKMKNETEQVNLIQLWEYHITVLEVGWVT